MDALLTEINSKLSRKSSFIPAVRDLSSLVKSKYVSAIDINQKRIVVACHKVSKLLKSRYTGEEFWKAGLNLFEDLQSRLTSPDELKFVNNFIIQAREQVGQSDNSNTNRPVQNEFLFEGQLSQGASESRQGPQTLWERMAVVDEESSLLGAFSVLNPQGSPASHETIQGEREDRATLPQEETAHLRHQRVLAAINALQSNPHRNLDFLEVMRSAMALSEGEEMQGLQDILQASMQDIQKGPPPASKAVVAGLPKVKLTLNTVDGKCTVCQEAFVVDDVMQIMPCKHSFHCECLGPWLEVHNSCPVCRHELKTDDEEYEMKKEQDRIHNQERKGIENALKLGEHMFIHV